jgi:hypothetical protein
MVQPAVHRCSDNRSEFIAGQQSRPVILTAARPPHRSVQPRMKASPCGRLASLLTR